MPSGLPAFIELHNTTLHLLIWKEIQCLDMMGIMKGLDTMVGRTFYGDTTSRRISSYQLQQRLPITLT